MYGSPYETWFVTREKLHWAQWLAEERTDLAFWTLGYPASPSLWLNDGRSMPLQDRAVSILAYIDTEDALDKPICFIAHSLGGLLIKQMLRRAVSGGTGEYQRFRKSAKGVLFLSTPHTGSNIASLVRHLGTILRPSVVIDDLQDNSAALRELNEWYVQNAKRLKIKTGIFYEKFDTVGVRIVDETSASMLVTGVTPTPVDANHIDICKPKRRTSPVHKMTKQFLAEVFPVSKK